MTTFRHRNFPQVPKDKVTVLDDVLRLPKLDVLAVETIRSKAIETKMVQSLPTTAMEIKRIHRHLNNDNFRLSEGYSHFFDELEPYVADDQPYKSNLEVGRALKEFATYRQMIEKWPAIRTVTANHFNSNLLEVHRRLGKGHNGWRQTDIGIRPDALGNRVIFPSARLRQRLLGSLHSFLWHHSENYPAISAAVAYAAVVHCHPFNDGNGRTARAIYNLVLSSSIGTRRFVPLYLITQLRKASFLLKLRRALYQSDWPPLFEFFTDAIILSCEMSTYFKTEEIEE